MSDVQSPSASDDDVDYHTCFEDDGPGNPRAASTSSSSSDDGRDWLDYHHSSDDEEEAELDVLGAAAPVVTMKKETRQLYTSKITGVVEMAEQTLSKRYLEERSVESDSDNDSDYELARHDIGETVTHIQADGVVQMGQGNSIVTHHNKNNITQNITVNVTAHVYIQNGLPPITVDHQQRLGFSQNSSGQTNNLYLDLGQCGSLKIPLPVSSGEGAREACSDAQIETKQEDIPVLSNNMTRTSSDTDPVQTRFFKQRRLCSSEDVFRHQALCPFQCCTIGCHGQWFDPVQTRFFQQRRLCSSEDVFQHQALYPFQCCTIGCHGQCYGRWLDYHMGQSTSIRMVGTGYSQVPSYHPCGNALNLRQNMRRGKLLNDVSHMARYCAICIPRNRLIYY